MATRRIGLQSFFDPNQKGFSEIFAEQATVQRQRKEAALGEIRQTLSEKQLYGAYAANANKILEDQIKSIGASLDVDPTAYTDAVADYLKFYNYSEQFKGFINEAASAYKADKEVDYNTALKAVRDQYVKTGNLDELETNIMNGVDAEKVLLQTPGALKEAEVMKDRISKLGDVNTLVTQIDENLKRQGNFYLQQDTETIKQAVNQAVEFDAKGNAVIKDMAALDRLGITQLMLGDRRVDALATQRLQREGKEINEANKKEALRAMMQPFASGERTQTTEAKLVDNPEWRKRLQEQKLSLQRARLAASQKGEKPVPLELMGKKLQDMYVGMAQAAEGNPQYIWKPYTRTVKAEGGKTETAAKSPAGKPYQFSSNVFKNEMASVAGKKVKINEVYLDSEFNIWANVQDVSEIKEFEPAKTKEGVVVSPAREPGTYYGRPRAVKFDPAMIELGSTAAMQDEYNKIAAGLEDLRSSIQASKRQPFQKPTNAAQLEESIKRSEQKSKESQFQYKQRDY